MVSEMQSVCVKLQVFSIQSPLSAFIVRSAVFSSDLRGSRTLILSCRTSSRPLWIAVYHHLFTRCSTRE
jgi:hypothetical protein